MSTKKSFIGIRSNTRYLLNYETNLLEADIELILLTTEPEYRLVRRKGERHVDQRQALREFRLCTSLVGLNTLIGKLQHLAVELQKVEQLGTGLNDLIKLSVKKDTPKPTNP